MFKAGDLPGTSTGEAQLRIEGEKLNQVIEVPWIATLLQCCQGPLSGHHWYGQGKRCDYHHGCWAK